LRKSLGEKMVGVQGESTEKRDERQFMKSPSRRTNTQTADPENKKALHAESLGKNRVSVLES
jgi:hypothetical protein